MKLVGNEAWLLLGLLTGLPFDVDNDVDAAERRGLVRVLRGPTTSKVVLTGLGRREAWRRFHFIERMTREVT